MEHKESTETSLLQSESDSKFHPEHGTPGTEGAGRLKRGSSAKHARMQDRCQSREIGGKRGWIRGEIAGPSEAWGSPAVLSIAEFFVGKKSKTSVVVVVKIFPF